MTGRRNPEQGVALISVMIAIMVISAFLLVSLKYGLSTSTSSRSDQDSKIATAAAQAGLEEYLSRLNASSQDNPYYQQGNDDTGNLAFTTGRTIPGAGTTAGSYTYKVLTTPISTQLNGVVRLRVTGKSRTVTRSLTASMNTRGFLNNIYFSNYEVFDPDLNGTPAACATYYYTGRKDNSACRSYEIIWRTGDLVNGPLHSNDALRAQSTGGLPSVNFANPTTETSWPDAQTAADGDPTWWGVPAAASLAGYSPVYTAPIAMPDANTALAKATTPGSDGNQTGTGCYYTGATKITFQGTTMTVLSPATKSSKIPARCYDVSKAGTAQSGLRIPPVIYVDSTTNTCTYGAIGYPATNEAAVNLGNGDTSSSWTTISGKTYKTTNYACTRGSAYVSGSADAQVTVATADDVVITGDLKTADNLTGTDVIGLISGNDIWVYHPITSAANNLLPNSGAVLNIQAAMLSYKHSFAVQNWTTGVQVGNLNVTGAIAQQYRGPVGSTDGNGTIHGYIKNYVWDSRLAYLRPPYFLESTSSAWAVTNVTDG